MKIRSSQAVARARGARSPKNVLCLAVDRLNADFLGAYGNVQAQTLAFDSLAAQSILFDSYFTTSLDLNALYRALWRGESPAEFELDQKNEPLEDLPTLFRLYKEQGYRVYIVSDVESVVLAPFVEEDVCDGRFFLGAPNASSPVEKLEDTKTFKNIEELAKFIVKLEDDSDLTTRKPWFVWAHLSGCNDVWDAPLERREQFREDEEDPEPYQGVEPPFWRRELDEKERGRKAKRTIEDEERDARFNTLELRRADADDRRQAAVEAYAAEISVFDETLEGFARLLEETGALNKTFFVLLGTRGMATGAPGAIGKLPRDERDPALAPFLAEDARQPLLMRLPDTTGRTVRLPALCEPRDVFATIRDWNETAARLASEDFWRIETKEVSPFAGVWSAEEEEKERNSDKTSEEEDANDLEDDVEGQELLRLLANEDASVRKRAIVVAKDATSRERAVVVDEWFLKQTPIEPDPNDENAPTTKNELFALPDDRFTVNDVADRRQDVVERLTRALPPLE